VLRRHPVLGPLTLAYLAFVGWVTLTPGAAAPTSSDLVLGVLDRLQRQDGLGWLTDQRAEYLANVALFVPLGLFLVLLTGSRYWWLALVAGLALTSSIETVQRVLPGRVPDERDVAANTLGTAVGIVLALVLTFPATLRRWVAEDDARHQRRDSSHRR
jgi:VanZ family protein